MACTDPSIELDRLLRALPDGGSVGLAEPGSPPDEGELVLVVDPALRGTALAALIDSAARAGAAAVVVPAGAAPPGTTSAGTAPVGTAPAGTKQAAGRTRLPVLEKPDAVGWRQLHAALSARLSQPRLVAEDELAELAQTIATLTGGLVTIEDTASRVLAYSRSSDEVDELRRMSILGRSGPPAYLSLLREWGVYHRLATPDEVVEIAEHPATGVRRRLAVGVFAGNRQLGTIWVQQGAAEFGPHARQALLGAARLTAAQLVGRGTRRAGAGHRLADLLAGRAGADSLGLGRDAGRPCAVAVIVPGAHRPDPAERAQLLDELAAIVTVQAAAFRRQAVVEQAAGRIQVLLPGLAEPPDAGADSPEALAMLEQTVTAVRRHLDPAARAGLGSVVPSVARAGDSARDAERALSVPAEEPVLSFSRARNRLIVEASRTCLSNQADLLDPRVADVISADRPSAETLLRYLETGSDVSRVATELEVHPTTVRHRLRRVARQLDLDLGDPADRLATQLQLEHGLRSAPGTA